MMVQWLDDRMRRALPVRRFAWMLAVIAMATACSDDPSGPENDPEPSAEDSAAGTFTLTAVGTSAIPATILSEGGYELQVIPSTATLSDDGSLLIAVNTREIVAGFASEYADTLRGTWTQHGPTVRFTIAPATESVLVGWDGTRITIGLIVATAEGNYVFTKE